MGEFTKGVSSSLHIRPYKLVLFKTEQLLLALCSRMERDLSVARSDIWTLISASEFSMPLLSIVDLINAFLSRYELSGRLFLI